MPKYRIGILQVNPQTLWRTGGGEVHAGKYLEYGNNEDFEVERFDFSRPSSYDLIHYFGAAYQMNEFGKYARLEGIKVVGTPILFPSSNSFKYRAFLTAGSLLPFPTVLQLRKDLLMNSDILIANSKPESTYFTEVYDVPPEKVITLGTGVDASMLEYSFEKAHLPVQLQNVANYILMVGRITPLKNQVAVAKLLARQGIPMVIVGKPDLSFQDYISELRDLVRRHKDIIWIEGLEAGSVALKAVYARAMAHVLWSDTEVAALVNLEAAALGCPVISRNHITTRDIMGANALYAGNERQLLERIKEVMGWSKEDRLIYKETARKFIAERHTWEIIVNDTLAIYRRLLSADNRR